MRPLIAVVVSLGLTLAFAPGALAQELPPQKPAEKPATDQDSIEYGVEIDPNVPIDADKMLELWAHRLGVVVVIDPQVGGTKIRFARSEVRLTWGLFKRLLDFHDIVLEERESGGRLAIFAHARRNLGSHIAGPCPVVLPGEPLPRSEQVVTALIQIKHGAGMDIFATVRGLLCRDVNRIANILYVRGPEVIIVVDFASSVDYYKKLIQSLDVPSVGGQVTRVIQIAHAPVEELAQELRVLGRTGNPTIVFDVRTNMLVLSCASDQMDELSRIIEALDVPSPAKVPAPTRPPAPPAAPAAAAQAPAAASHEASAPVAAAPAPVVLAAPQAPPSSPWSSYAWPMATLVAGLGFLRQLAITWRLYKKLGYHSRSADPGPLSLG